EQIANVILHLVEEVVTLLVEPWNLWKLDELTATRRRLVRLHGRLEPRPESLLDLPAADQLLLQRAHVDLCYLVPRLLCNLALARIRIVCKLSRATIGFDVPCSRNLEITNGIVGFHRRTFATTRNNVTKLGRVSDNSPGSEPSEG